MAKKRNEEEIAATVAELPTVPPDGWIDTMLERRMLSKDKLIYRVAYIENPLTQMKEKMVKVTCTACGETAYLEYAGGGEGCHCGYGSTYGFIDLVDKEEKRSGSTCLCPCCGKGMKALHVGYISHIRTIDEQIVVSLHKVRGHIALLSWWVEKRTNKEGAVTYLPNLYEGVIVVDGTLVRVRGYFKFISSITRLDHWEALKRFSEDFPWVDDTDILPFERHIEYGTELENSALTEYLLEGKRQNPSKYIKLWKRYPKVEAVVKAGASNYVSQVIGLLDDSTGYNYNAHYTMQLGGIDKYFDLKEKKPHRILGVEKSEWGYVMQGYKVLYAYKEMKKLRGVRMTVDEIATMQSLGFTASKYNMSDTMLLEGINGYMPPVVRTIRYLERQAKEHGSMVCARYYRDFLDMQEKVYGGIEEERSFPKNLVEAHDHLVNCIKEKEDAEINRQMQERLKDIGRLAFTDEKLGLFIKPCESHAEIIKEGKLLSHCVASYAKQHAEGKTTILFIRHIAEPEKPYFTLEYNGDQVLQNRGYQNCKRTDEVITFEKEWLEYIKTIKEKKNGRNHRSKQTVGA